MSRALETQDIQRSLREYGYAPNVEFVAKLQLYIALLLRWNEKISLTRVVQPIDIVRFHFGESLMVLSLPNLQSGRLADVGSGAGFPAFPLAMAVPALHVTLIEANAKKAAFLSEVRRRLEQDNVKIYHGRSESLPQTQCFDFVSSRAVSDQEELLKWSEARLGESGRVLLWIGAAAAQRIRTSDRWKWESQLRIPRTKERLILVGTPRRVTR